MKFVTSLRFWVSFFVSTLVLGLLFAWELGAFGSYLPLLPRPPVRTEEIVFTITLIVLISLNVGLYRWRCVNGSCPIGVRRATGLGGTVGAIALLCPLCLLIPVSFLGISISLAVLAPFMPLLQLIAIVLLVPSTVMLWPRT